MSLTADEKVRVGVVVHLTGPEYQSVMAQWRVDIPDHYNSSLEALKWCRYVAFIVDSTIKSVGEITSWSFQVGDECKRTAHFSLLSNHVTELRNQITFPAKDILWLTHYQREAVQQSIATSPKQKPEVGLPSLDIDEATASIAQRYSIDPLQVEITIRSRSAAR